MSTNNNESETNVEGEAMLSPIEARVLAVLMEKQLTTPDAYPLTLNSLHTGCNQKTSREPVSHYSKGDVEHCLNRLRERKFVEVEYGSRANRFDQRLSRVLYLDKAMQALVTVLMLRGPQTVNELFSRTERMARFNNPAAVEEVLQTFCQKTSPIVVHIPRQVGQREDRYMHLLCGEPDLSQWALARTDSGSGLDGGHVAAGQSGDLVARVEELERQLNKVLDHLNLNNE